jgi:hypothetical protein
MGRRSSVLIAQETAGTDNVRVIQVVSRAFDIVRCFDGRSTRLGNREIADRCGLPRSTVSRLTLTLTQIGQLIYLPHEQKYALAPDSSVAGAPLLVESCNEPVYAEAQGLDEPKAPMQRGIGSRFECFEDERNSVAAPLAVTAPCR